MYELLNLIQNQFSHFNIFERERQRETTLMKWGGTECMAEHVQREEDKIL